MAILQISKIQVRTGNYDELPQLSVGEFGWASDQRRLFIGNEPSANANLVPNVTEILTSISANIIGGGGNGEGTVTSINVSTGNIGLTTIGGPITSSGTITIGGILNISHGGTGADTSTDALNNLLPTQSGQAGKLLSTNGTNATWVTPTYTGTVTSINVVGGNSGLTTTGGPVTTSGVITIDGVLSITHGGTGAVTSDGALLNLLPNQTGNNGKFLTTDGVGNVSWAEPIGVVSSVDVSGGTTGLTTSGGPIVSSGTITLSGTLAIEHGGTNAATAEDGIRNLLPDQTGNEGKFLTTDGANVSWVNQNDLLMTIVDDASPSRDALIEEGNGKTLIRMTYDYPCEVIIRGTSEGFFWPLGSVLLVSWAGNGQVSIVAGTGVTINTPETLSIRRKFGKVSIINVATDIWDIEGNLDPAP